MSDEDISRILTLLVDADGPDVIPIGRLPALCLANWPRRATDHIVITRDRRNHYLTNHPEMHQFEYTMVRGITEPDEIHRNKYDGNMAIVYMQVSEARWLRSAVIVSHSEGLQNSIASCRLARAREVLEGRKANRLVWSKR